MDIFDKSKTIFNYKTHEEEPVTVSGTPEELQAHFGVGMKFLPREQVSKEGVIFFYAGFEPVAMGGMVKIYYEQNGRKAVRSKTSSGSHSRSMTKERVLEGHKQDTSVMTKACADHTAKALDHKEKSLMSYYKKNFTR